MKNEASARAVLPKVVQTPGEGGVTRGRARAARQVSPGAR